MTAYIGHSRILLSLIVIFASGFALQALPAGQPGTGQSDRETQQANKLTFESEAKNGGKISITGTSSIHDWEVVGKEISGTLTLTPVSGADDVLDLGANLPAEARVEVRVKSLESGKGGMDKKMFKAMETGKHKVVSFVLDSLEVVKDGPNKTNTERTLNVEAIGKLTIVGNTRLVKFPATIEWHPKEKTLSVSGEVDLRMTDFGIDPPTALFGTIRTGDEITVRFKWTPRSDEAQALIFQFNRP